MNFTLLVSLIVIFDIDNVYIADDGIVFLDDLEYLTPVNDPPPHFTRLPYGVTEDQVVTALKLDDFQFITFQCMVTNLKRLIEVLRRRKNRSGGLLRLF
jgi:hypothetical protein